MRSASRSPKLGGLRNTLAAARICEAGRVDYRMGAAVGSRLLSAQAMHLAATLPGIEYACELGEFARLLDDPFEGIEIENGRLKLPEGLGSGVSWCKAKEPRRVRRAAKTRRPSREERRMISLTAPHPNRLALTRSGGPISPQGGGGFRFVGALSCALAVSLSLIVGFAAAAPAVNIATYKGPDRETLILDGAKREGKVSIYSGMIENQALRPLVEAFEKRYPFVDVEYWRGDSRAMVQKLFSEQRARRVIGDIFKSTGGAEVVIRAGASQPIWSPSAANYPQAMIDPDGMWIASRLELFRRCLQHAPGAGGRSAKDL